MKTICYGLLAFTAFVTNTVNATQKPIYTQLSAIPEVSKVESCFSGKQADYQTFIDNTLLELKATYKNLSTKMLTKGFPEERFNHIKDNYNCLIINYISGDANVEGFLLTKKALEDPQSLVVFNRGGNGSFGKQSVMQMLKQLPLVDQGAIVIASQYRDEDEFGGKDIQDVHVLIDIAKQLTQIKEGKIDMIGVSRGGMTSYMVAKDRSDIDGLVIWAGVSDIAIGLTQRPEMERVYKYRIPKYEQNKAQEIAKRSAIQWVDKLDSEIRVLLLHGDSDQRVNVSQAQMMDTKLSELSRPHKLVIYPNGKHNLKKYSKQVYNEISSWIFN